MNVKDLVDAATHEVLSMFETTKGVAVYTTNDNGNLVRVSGVKTVTMRDTEGDTVILVIEREGT